MVRKDSWGGEMSVFAVPKTAEKVKNGKDERYSHERPIKNLTAAIPSIRPARNTGCI
jgi:hypothetical protein